MCIRPSLHEAPLRTHIMVIFSHFYGMAGNKKQKGNSLLYRSADSANAGEYALLINNGMKSVKKFFSSRFECPFKVYIHPDRQSLDSTWRHDWQMPGFKSECWMVASGIGDRLDMISPVQWSSQSCEHDYSSKQESQRLILHELIHVYHGQKNPGKDFSATENLDWFVEGLAVYASGQLTVTKLSAVRQAARDGKMAASLNDFWEGDMRYQLSGSVPMYIDKTYGRKKLKSLLPFTTKAQLLSSLGISEEALITSWKSFLEK